MHSLTSDGAASSRRFAQDAGILHEWVQVRVGVHTRGAIHIRHANGWHARFKGWLMQLRGVASLYLAHYSGWRGVHDARRLTTPAHLLLVAARIYV
jgi:aromatic ring-cleaving dioxygenase